jgi:hypothetical protein
MCMQSPGPGWGFLVLRWLIRLSAYPDPASGGAPWTNG